MEDTIIQSNQATTISNMRVAVRDTNVILNMAVSPGLMLVPSSMVILKKAVVGYNNILKTATEDMKFGQIPK